MLAVFNDETSKVSLIKKKIIFMFNNIGLDTQRFDQQI